MPGKVSWAREKIRSVSDSQLDVTKKAKNILDYEPIESTEDMSDSECNSNWFKTWPERRYDKSGQSRGQSEEGSGAPKTGDKSPVPLNAVLDAIPLAYSPVTKQLHFLDSNENRRDGNREMTENAARRERRFHYSASSEDGSKQVDECRDSNIILDLAQNLGKDLVLRSCLKRLELSPEEKFNFLWNSKIGYSDPRRSGTPENLGGDSSAPRTEASSFSSIVSSLSGGSPSNLDDSSSGRLPFFENDDLLAKSQCSHDSGSNCGENSEFFEDKTSEPPDKCDEKTKGFSGFFSRNVFSRRGATRTPTIQGWKLFSRNRNQISSNADTSSPGDVRSSEPSSITDSPLGSKKYEDVVASSSALILHNRPSNLPAKSVVEEHKHKMEYQQMVEAAKRKEIKETKLRKKHLQQQLKSEEQLVNASRVWNSEIIPKWGSMKNSRKARDLWWSGLPPCVRGKVWKLAIGNELNITNQLYQICLARAQEKLRGTDAISTAESLDNADKESSVELIQLDISRTFPNLCIFQKGGPYYDILHCLLSAYVCYRPDVGYVQGMSFIAAILILNLEAADAFISFANLLNRPCHMAFFSLNQPVMQAYYDTYNDFFRENLPRLSQHFEESSLTTDLYLLDWVYSVFAKAMPLDLACRVWDVYLRDGEEFLFRAALGILHLHKEKLMKLDFLYAAQFLTKLPEDLSANQLFRSIEAIKMNVGKQKFNQVLAGHMERRSR